VIDSGDTCRDAVRFRPRRHEFSEFEAREILWPRHALMEVLAGNPVERLELLIREAGQAQHA
jgi:hypothetical protein